MEALRAAMVVAYVVVGDKEVTQEAAQEAIQEAEAVAVPQAAMRVVQESLVAKDLAALEVATETAAAAGVEGVRRASALAQRCHSRAYLHVLLRAWRLATHTMATERAHDERSAQRAAWRSWRRHTTALRRLRKLRALCRALSTRFALALGMCPRGEVGCE